MSGLVTVTVIAERLRVSRRTVVRYRHQGMPGPVVPATRDVRPNLPALYSWVAIEEWAESAGLYDSVVGIATPNRAGRYDRKELRHAAAV